MLEEHTAKFLIVAIFRALLGRRSCALMFRPGEAVRSSAPRHLVKKMLLKVAKALPTVTVATIMPFELDPAFAGIADGWIYDPQLWDLAPDEDAHGSDLARTVREQAAGRAVAVALGGQSRDKGFDFLADVWAARPGVRDRWLFVAAGKVASGSREKADRFADQQGLLVDRFVTDAELRDLYREATVVWGCYSPDYDQASGIFGRAVQTGRPIVVREGAYVERLAEILEHPMLAIPWNDTEAAAAALASPPAAVDKPATKVATMRERSIATLSHALGLPLAGSAS
ncbi:MULTISPECIES: hypothetical protein [unclassified Caulobacter]|uniref:hypothetical protein n=1 Tax=unclassified Caulobacter TaxID=2648921 RepID=UPI0012E37B29|nr:MULTISPECIES: hypothetical protein [unclassified Caulobacter]